MVSIAAIFFAPAHATKPHPRRKKNISRYNERYGAMQQQRMRCLFGTRNSFQLP